MKTNETEFLFNIGLQLRILRRAAGFDRAENFALSAGISASQYYKWEQGAPICLHGLMKVCDAFDITVEQFFSQIKQPTFKPLSNDCTTA